VVLFAGGVSMPLAMTELPAPSLEWRELEYVASTEFRAAAPHYFLLPAQAPPAV
jgi:hypothetical protein